MKIILINNLYKPYAVGGAEKVVEKQAIELADKGNEVVIITSAPWRGWGSWVPQKGMEDDVLIYRYWVPNLCWYKNLAKHGFFFKLVWHFIDLFNFWSGRIVRDILEKEKPDEVVLHNLMGIGYGVIARKRRGGADEAIPMKQKIASPVARNDSANFILYLHDVQLVEPSGVLPWDHVKDNIWQKIYSEIMKRKFRNVDQVISPTEFLQEFYQSRGFFINAKWKTERPQTSDLRPQKQIDRSPPSSRAQAEGKSEVQFLFVGSLVPHKGIRILMQVWDVLCHCEETDSHQLTKQSPSLHIVGNGILHKEVVEWTKNHPEVTIHGRLEAEKLAEIYQQSDVLIFPSICLENNPTVIHEALHHGLQVIASDTGGVREIFGEIENVKLVEPGNVEDLRLGILPCFSRGYGA